MTRISPTLRMCASDRGSGAQGFLVLLQKIQPTDKFAKVESENNEDPLVNY